MVATALNAADPQSHAAHSMTGRVRIFVFSSDATSMTGRVRIFVFSSDATGVFEVDDIRFSSDIRPLFWALSVLLTSGT
ncbi:Uncharacterised protein [Chlamydia trachomatis]|nr:Uncharacterised protein [Chlamydia trachomatis]